MRAADLTDDQLMFARALTSTVEQFDRHLTASLERLADRMSLSLDDFPASVITLAALGVGGTGPRPYAVLPWRSFRALGIDSYPLAPFLAPGPAGYRCWPPFEDNRTGADWWCLLPQGHECPHGYDEAHRIAADAAAMGLEPEFDDAGEFAELEVDCR